MQHIQGMFKCSRSTHLNIFGTLPINCTIYHLLIICSAGVRNSRVILMYTQYDPRVRPILMTIRYWFKVHKLTGTINNYSVTMLVLFFLQTGLVPVVPKFKDVVIYSGEFCVTNSEHRYLIVVFAPLLM